MSPKETVDSENNDKLEPLQVSPNSNHEPGEENNRSGNDVPEEETFLSGFFYLLREILITLLLFLALRNFVVQARYIPSPSMRPGLQEGDRLLVELVSKNFGTYERGDILVFYKPGHPHPTLKELLYSSFGMHDDKAMIKRVIGLPGEIVQVIPNVGVKVNGKLLEETYTSEKSHFPNAFGPETVPEGQLFMMGDNRNQSADSRRWGTLPTGNIVGKATVRFYPFHRFGMIK